MMAHASHPAAPLWARLLAVLAIVGLLSPGAPALAAAREQQIAGADSFRVGTSGVLCTAQRHIEDAHYRSMLDRAFEVVCRDAATPVATLYALRGDDRLDDQTMAALPAGEVVCDAPVAETVPDLPGLRRRDCRDRETGLERTVYTVRRHGETLAAEGFTAYQSVLVLGLRSLATNRQVPGEISVAIVGADDPAKLARLQAERLDPAQALVAAYSNANEGSYANASEFFDRLVARAQMGEPGATRPAEYLANLAMEQSILGDKAESEALFARAERANVGASPGFARLFRNLKAMHRLDEHDAAGALAILDAPLPKDASETTDFARRLHEGVIEPALAQRLELDDAGKNRLWVGAADLTDDERNLLLDAQAMELRGLAAWIQGDRGKARTAFAATMKIFNSVRGGGVASMAWLPADVQTLLAGLAEADGRFDEAEVRLRQSAAIIGGQMPESAVLLAARARLAGSLARHGKAEPARALFRELVQAAPGIPGGSDALRPLIGRYFGLLVKASDQSGASADFFLAAQALARPGVARTQAVLARELSGGSDAASDLFRQSIALSREIVALDRDVTRLSDPLQRKTGDGRLLAAALARRQQAAAQQTAVLARMAAYPRYRAVANQTVELGELQKVLRKDEGYYKLVIVGDDVYAIWVRADAARIFRVDARPADLDDIVKTIRDSVVVQQGNQLVTNPFDLETARRLYVLLLGPVEADFAKTTHLIFEPDGALLKLPANLLVSDAQSVTDYKKRQALPTADPFDFTGVAWVGRSHIVTTAVSSRSFMDIRSAPPSTAHRRYLGLGQNAPVNGPSLPPAAAVARDPCDWALDTWNHPVNGKELSLAAQIVGGTGNEVLVGDAFTDTAIKARTDLNDFRIVQFATHGLVTAPHPGCPARPALITSFGSGASQGLLTFKDIFDLQLNADTVVLSACDTAGAASVFATREAGLSTGGNFALDGLVRAFIGAGARAVVASHWPVPDDFDATSRLMGGVFKNGLDHSLGEAVRTSQTALMDDPLTSHPYYWAAFAIVGDATKPLTTR